jgi:hypothetical protein
VDVDIEAKADVVDVDVEVEVDVDAAVDAEDIAEDESDDVPPVPVPGVEWGHTAKWRRMFILSGASPGAASICVCVCVCADFEGKDRGPGEVCTHSGGVNTPISGE